jgi:hypothetical protein
MADRGQGEPGRGGEPAGLPAAPIVADAEGDAADAETREAAEDGVVAKQRKAEDLAGRGRRDQAGDRGPGEEQRIGDDAGMAAGAEKNQIRARICARIWAQTRAGLTGSNRTSPRSAPSR